ncbi:hypothetical protein CHS0354_017016, partial [Potamilus streckersoni]
NKEDKNKKKQEDKTKIYKKIIDITKPRIEITSESQLDPQTILELPPPLSSSPSEKTKGGTSGFGRFDVEEREREGEMMRIAREKKAKML